MINALALWRDRRGRLSPLRIATLATLAWPAALMLVDFARGALGGRPLNELIHRTGWWALVFLLVSLAITPLRRSARFAKLIDVRRMIGVGAFAYALGHILLYVADQGFNLAKVASEIVLRLYLTIGFVALLGLTVLAATSNDAMVRRLGGLRWRRLHRATFVVTTLALIHFFQQTKADVTVPTLYAGLFGWLVLYRLFAAWRGEAALTPLALVANAVVASALTFAGEAIGIAIAFKQPLLGFLPLYAGTVFDLAIGVRPGWWLLLAGLAVALLDWVQSARERRRANASPSRRPRPAGRAEPAGITTT